jgi:Tol biopolymer transport system component/predicted Ser/Thr protein kinase
MSLPPGTAFGPYLIVGPLGAGGMGEVYRARDTKLDRDVALKTLPDAFANDADRLARFEREAKTLASLNHPHIAQVYAIEGAAIVMELVEGEDLAERLKRGPIPLDEALPFARQIAEALEAAHDAGIIHRDLKPGNVKVRADGTIKVLDFGLAKASGPIAASSSIENSPTITTPAMTMQGVILGTAAYMAPEQAKGKVVDRRADIWAFGCVLYEMLTGARTFAGEDVSDTLVSILRDDPRWAALPAGTPSNVRQLLRRCLQKDPRQRLPHIGAARLELTEPVAETPADLAPERNGRPWPTVAALGALVGGLAVAVVMYAIRPAPRAEAREVVRFTVDAVPGSTFTGANGAPRFALSPDGRQLVYQVQNENGAKLYTRALDATAAEPVPGTEVAVGGGGTQGMFWSPDGRFLAFFDESSAQLKKLDRTNGLVQVIAEVPGNQLSGSWNDAGTIVFAAAGTEGVRSVPASGGAVTQLTTLDAAKGESAHLWPDFLPDGIHFVFQVSRLGSERTIYLGSLDGAAPVRLFESQTGAVVARPDQLLFGHDGALMSQVFDPRTLAMVGTPRIVADRVPATAAGRVAASASRSGVLAIGTGGVAADTAPLETYWIDRAGGTLSDAPPSVSVGAGIRLSQDGRRLLYARGSSAAGVSLWVQDIGRGIEARLSAPALNAVGGPPVFSPDGARVLYRQAVAGAGILFIQPASGTTAPVELIRGAVGENLVPVDWAQDGRILYTRSARMGERKLQFVEGEHNRRPIDYLDLAGGPGASLSPDGRWLAYASVTGGQSQVFVQSFPDPSVAKVAASGPGASYPRWNPKGGELFFVSYAQRVMAVPVKTTPQLEVGAPVALFELNAGGQTNPGAFVSPFDVMPDGRRFVALRPTGATNDRSQPIVVTINWQSAVR